MTLEVIKDGKIEVYPDETKLNARQWSEILGINHYTITAALNRQGLRPEIGLPRYPGQPNQIFIHVKTFPKIILGLASSRVFKLAENGDYYHPWAANVDTTQNFQVVNHKGTTLLYTYPKK